MDYLEKVCSSKTNNINRKSILIPLAKYLDIDHTLFKNRKLLIKEIQSRCPPSKRCENSEDFITLCPIDSIPKERLFIWSQNKKTFGCDIVSLKQYIDSGKTMNPWTIDYATGVEESKNRENYIKKFDMERQKGLIQRINDEYSKININVHLESESEINMMHKKRFEIEDIGDNVDLYITHLIDCTEHLEFRIFLYVISDTLKSCIHYFQIHQEMKVVYILEQLFIQNEVMKFHTGIPGVTTEDKYPETISTLLDLLNVFIHQRENIYADGIIKYFFIEIEECFKNYNLLI